MNKRIFLVDFLCALPYGHCLHALTIYSRLFENWGYETIKLACRELPPECAEGKTVHRDLIFPYKAYFKLAKSRNYDLLTNFSQTFPRCYRKLMSLSSRVLNEDVVLKATGNNWKILFRRYDISKSDTIFFHSSDYYGLVSLIDFLLKLSKNDRPKIHFRLIGVAENLTYKTKAKSVSFLDKCREALANGINLTFSAECPSYIDLLEKLLQNKVHYFPYPLDNDLVPIETDSIFRVGFPGQGRLDKGFREIYSIFLEFSRIVQTPFIFDVQDMPDNSEYYDKRYSWKLKNTPGILLRDALLTQDIIDGVYRKSKVMLLPYDKGTYLYRSSAVFQESLAMGRKILCYSGLGFSDLVMRYKCGSVASSVHDFAEKLLELNDYDNSKYLEEAISSRKIYQSDLDKVKSFFTDWA